MRESWVALEAFGRAIMRRHLRLIAARPTSALRIGRFVSRRGAPLLGTIARRWLPAAASDDSRDWAWSVVTRGRRGTGDGEASVATDGFVERIQRMNAAKPPEGVIRTAVEAPIHHGPKHRAHLSGDAEAVVLVKPKRVPGALPIVRSLLEAQRPELATRVLPATRVSDFASGSDRPASPQPDWPQVSRSRATSAEPSDSRVAAAARTFGREPIVQMRLNDLSVARDRLSALRHPLRRPEPPNPPASLGSIPALAHQPWRDYGAAARAPEIRDAREPQTRPLAPVELRHGSPMIRRERDRPRGRPSDAAPPGSAGEAVQRPARSVREAVDIDDLVARVLDRVVRELSIEVERRGSWPWPWKS